MLKSFLQSLSDDNEPSSGVATKNDTSVATDSDKITNEISEPKINKSVSSPESVSEKYCDVEQAATGPEHESSSNSQSEVSGETRVDDSISTSKVSRDYTARISLNEENDECTTSCESDEDATDDESEEETNNPISNRFDHLTVADDTSDSVADGYSANHSDEKSCSETAGDYTNEPTICEESAIREVSSRRKKNRRKHLQQQQRRRQIAGIRECINVDDVDAPLSKAHESQSDEGNECIIKSTGVNPLNIRVERKYLNYSTELKLKSLSASEAALFKRTLAAAKNNNRHLSPHSNKFCLGNGSRFPSLSKLDASMQFDEDNPTPSHVLGVTEATKGDKSFHNRKSAPRNMYKLQLFKIVHHEKYQQISKKLASLTSAVDYEVGSKLVEILSSHPCHLETLVQLACMVEPSDVSTCSELIERAAIALESIFHPRFLPSSTACRMDYRRRENRVYFIALLKHAQFISQVHKCHRTALEMCKSLYSIDPLNDPLASLLVLDHYALACGQYTWIIETYHQSLEDASIKDRLHHLPNWPYSAALAAYLSKQYSLADKLIDQALALYPSVLRHLLDQCSVEPDAGLIDCDYFDFKKPSNHLPLSLNLLILLYTKRSSCHWSSDRKILNWLESRVALFVIAFKDNNTKEYNFKSNESLFKRYPLPAKNISRHLVLSGIASLKEQVVDSSTVTKYHDPIAPGDEIESYDLSSQDDADANADGVLSLFLKSLLPDYSITSQSIKRAVARETNHPPSPNHNHQESAADKLTSANNLKSSVSSVLTAVRDLLSSMTQDADDHEDASANVSREDNDLLVEE